MFFSLFTTFFCKSTMKIFSACIAGGNGRVKVGVLFQSPCSSDFPVGIRVFFLTAVLSFFVGNCLFFVTFYHIYTQFFFFVVFCRVFFKYFFCSIVFVLVYESFPFAIFSCFTKCFCLHFFLVATLFFILVKSALLFPFVTERFLADFSTAFSPKTAYFLPFCFFAAFR